jgi:benzoate membrane transport protein
MPSSSSPIRLNDLTHPIVAGLISVIVNYGGTFILVFQAAKVAGLSPELTASWVWSVSIGVGLTGLFLSWRFREPIITAWSTPAAAFLVTALATTPYAEAVPSAVHTVVIAEYHGARRVHDDIHTVTVRDLV